MGSGLPPFDAFTPEQIAPAIDLLIAQTQAQVALSTAPSTELTWEKLVVPLEQVTEKMSRAWGMIGHLNGVADSPELRDAYNAKLPAVTQLWTGISQNLALFEKYKALKASPAWGSLSPAQRKAIENSLRSFRLGGAELQGPARARFAAIADSQAALQQKFSENVLDATNAYELIITDEKQLAGVPSDALAVAKQPDAATPSWRFTLQFPSYFPIL